MSWQAAQVARLGAGWWNDPAKLRQVAIEQNRLNGPRTNLAVAGVLTGQVGVTFRIDASKLDRRLKQLPERLALRLQRRAIRRGLVVWQALLRSMFARHRSDYVHPHLNDHVAVVSRVYRHGHGRRIIWGGAGIRKGAASSRQLQVAAKASIAEGGDERATYRRLFSQQNKPGFRELPGWRLHFLESGTRAKRRRGVFYFPKAMAAAGGTVLETMRTETQRLLREVTA